MVKIQIFDQNAYSLFNMWSGLLWLPKLFNLVRL